jgi:SOS response regulatory protein OraA/RecX
MSQFDQSVDFDRKKTFKQDFGLPSAKNANAEKNLLDKGLNEDDINENEEDEDEEDSEHLVEVLNRQYEQTIASQV